jgi:hypothetical protein
VGSAGLVAVREEGVQGEEGCSVEVLGGEDLWGLDGLNLLNLAGLC